MQHQVSAVLLAAGSARRMGQLKQLLPLGSLTVIEHCANTIFSAGISDVVLVIGPDGEAVSSAVEHLPVRVAMNHDHGSDMAASVRVGLHALKDSASAVMICLADHPLVQSETMKLLLVRHQANPASIIIPSHNRRRGHPTLFPRKIIQEIFESSSLRDVIGAHVRMTVYLNTEDEGVLLDMDTPQDYERILRKLTMTSRKRSDGSESASKKQRADR
jgi:molybdenum cofactor cytidylyltransferase